MEPVGPKDAISELKHFINSSSATRKWQMKGTFRPSKSDKLLNTTKTPSNMMLNRGKGAHAVENCKHQLPQLVSKKDQHFLPGDFNLFEKYFHQIEKSSPNRGEHKICLSCHHLDQHFSWGFAGSSTTKLGVSWAFRRHSEVRVGPKKSGTWPEKNVGTQHASIGNPIELGCTWWYVFEKHLLLNFTNFHIGWTMSGYFCEDSLLTWNSLFLDKVTWGSASVHSSVQFVHTKSLIIVTGHLKCTVFSQTATPYK